jgi:tRNA pseudouridine38-40 synthase
MLALVYCYHDDWCCGGDDASPGQIVGRKQLGVPLKGTGDQVRKAGLHDSSDDEDSARTAHPLIVPVPMPLTRLAFTLNRMLPADVRIVSIAGVDAGAAAAAAAAASSAAAAAASSGGPELRPAAVQHCRPRLPLSLQALVRNVRKTYRYRFSAGPFQDPMQRRTAWHVVGAGAATLDWDAMRRACRLLEGTHDFRAFQGSPRGSEARDPRTACTLESVRLEMEIGEGDPDGGGRGGTTDERAVGRCFALFVTGDRFLYKMVRLIAGCVADVGRGRMELADLEEALRSGSRGALSRALECAPAHGLALVGVRYDPSLDLEWL